MEPELPNTKNDQVISAPGQPVGFFARHQRSIWLTLGGTALAVAGLLAFILFFGNTIEEPEYTGDVRVEIIAPEESVSGSEMSFTVSISNLGSVKLTNAKIEMFYPAGFAFLRAQIPGDSGADDTGRTFNLPDVPRGENLSLVIIGRLEGNVQEIKTIKTRLHYLPENFNSVFLATASASIVILPPDISLRVLGPSSIISGQVIEYEVEIRNISMEEFRNLSLELSYPPGFSFLEATHPPSGTGEKTWEIDNLSPADTKTVRVKGRMTEKPGEEVYLAAELFTLAADGKLSAGRSYIFTHVLDSPLLLTQKLLGGEGTVFGGEKMQYEINYENIGQIGLSNVTISMRFESRVFDLMKSKSQTGQLRGNEMVWLPAAVPELRTVQVGQRGRFTVDMPLLPENQLTLKNPVAETRIQFAADEISEPISGAPLSLKLGTNLNLTSAVRLISGPEKPVVGAISVFLVTLTVRNSVNDVENGELTARLPGSTVTLDQNTLGPEEERANFEFVAAGGLLKWRLGKIFAYSGALHDPRTISFQLAVSPEKEGSGSQVLLSDAGVSGLDSFTGEQIFSNNLEKIEAR